MKLGIEDIRHLIADEAKIEPTVSRKNIKGLDSFNSSEGLFGRLFKKRSSGADSELQQEMGGIVENVYKDIKEYTSAEDLIFLKRLLLLCRDYKLTKEKSRMHRNMGMYYFQNNKTGESIEEFNKAIGLVEDGKSDGLRLAYYSDLGLVYYYNSEFSKARHCYDMVENLLPSAEVDGNVLFLHNYRSGILYGNLQEYEVAISYFEKAFDYALSSKDKGFALMNMGVIYKKQRNFDKAAECYRTSLNVFEEEDYLSKSVVYNNLAELHKMYGQYEKALFYIDIAFKNLGNKNMTKRFIYFSTYTEIKILMGEPGQAFEEFLELLSQVEDYHPYKSFVIEGINNMALLASEDGCMLAKLEAAVVMLMGKTADVDDEYRKELKACMNNISTYKYDLMKQKSIFV